MPDPKFFQKSPPMTLGALAEIGECALHDSQQADTLIHGVGPLTSTDPNTLSFLDNPKYLEAFRNSSVAACVVHADRVTDAPSKVALLLSPKPYRSFALIGQAFYPGSKVEAGIAPSAFVDPTAQVAPSCCIEPGAVIEANATVGEGTIIGPNTVVRKGVTIGSDCRIGPNASLEYCIIGDRVQIHAGARIGTRGFGFAMDARGHVELRQLGRVLVGNDVEIGANTTIDRGMGPDTIISDGVKIDNLVQIAHNVELGKGVVLAGQSGIAGSAVLEDFVVLAAKAGVSGHLTIGTGTQVGGLAGVTKSLPPGQKVVGIPAEPMRDWLAKNALLKRMLKMKNNPE